MYESWNILVDTAAEKPGLGFGDAAAALSDLALRSPPQFAIGIFGVWGSGKTTLMRSIEACVAADPTAVPVWFNAWRYEREDHLIVPMLDTIRDSLVTWAACHPDDEAVAGGRLQKVASTFSKAARAIFAGLTVKAQLFGVEASMAANKVVAEWRSTSKDEDKLEALTPQSFYHASFHALEGAIEQFVGGGRRIVVFIDDLDRCLPEHALEVIESVKLFFDLPGFVFVVGLDTGVIERAVASKFNTSAVESTAGGVSYVKKIFQVQFAVPRVLEDQLDDFVGLITAALPAPQAVDVRTTVRPHLRHLATKGSVNQREVKRFLNDYTVQLKMLERKLASADPATSPDPDVVLALLTMSFHPAWRSLYEQLIIDPEEFQGACNDALRSPEMSLILQLGPVAVPLPTSFLTYLQHEGRCLVRPGLQVYVSSVESTSTTDTTVVETMRMLRAIRRTIATLDELETRRNLRANLARFSDVLGTTALGPSRDAARDAVEKVRESLLTLRPEADDGWEAWRLQATNAFEAVDFHLQDLRRRVTS